MHQTLYSLMFTVSSFRTAFSQWFWCSVVHSGCKIMGKVSAAVQIFAIWYATTMIVSTKKPKKVHNTSTEHRFYCFFGCNKNCFCFLTFWKTCIYSWCIWKRNHVIASIRTLLLLNTQIVAKDISRLGISSKEQIEQFMHHLILWYLIHFYL